jgi:hypothetical protein
MDVFISALSVINSVINYILRISNKKYDKYNITLSQLDILDKTNIFYQSISLP